jgi:hypothetical protein
MSASAFDTIVINRRVNYYFIFVYRLFLQREGKQNFLSKADEVFLLNSELVLTFTPNLREGVKCKREENELKKEKRGVDFGRILKQNKTL